MKGRELWHPRIKHWCGCRGNCPGMSSRLVARSGAAILRLWRTSDWLPLDGRRRRMLSSSAMSTFGICRQQQLPPFPIRRSSRDEAEAV